MAVSKKKHGLTWISIIGGGAAGWTVNTGLGFMADTDMTPFTEYLSFWVLLSVCGDLESSPPIDIHDLFENQTLFTHNHPEYWDNLLNAIHVKYHKVRTMVVTQVHITKKFIEEGLGFSFLPKIALNRELMEGRLLEVRTPELKLPKASTYLVTRADTEENRLFQDFLGEYFSY